MTKRNQTNRPVGESDGAGPNLLIVAAIVGVAAIVLIVLAVLSTRDTSGGGLTINDRNATTEAAATQAAGDAEAAAELARSGLPTYCSDNPERCISTGSADAPVTIYEVSDYGCPACKSFNETTLPQLQQQYIDAGIVRLVKLPSMLLGNDKQSAANAVLCAHEQGSGAAMHVGIFGIQVSGSAPRAGAVSDLAQSLGLDMDRFDRCVSSNAYAADAQANTRLVIDLGTTATPTFYINGERVVGADLAPLTAAIQRHLSD